MPSAFGFEHPDLDAWDADLHDDNPRAAASVPMTPNAKRKHHEENYAPNSAPRGREDCERAEREFNQVREIDRVHKAANAYQVLNLSVRSQTEGEICSAYRAKSLMVHPDKAPATCKDAAEEAFNKVNSAYNELKDSKKQAALLHKLAAEAARKAREAAEARAAEARAAEARATEEARRAAEAAQEADLFPWQKKMDEMVNAPVADDRKLDYFKGPGDVGMTYMARYLKKKYGNRVLVITYSSSRHALLAVLEAQDELNAMDQSGIVILDIPRAAFLNGEFYIAAEIIKSGNFQSPLKPLKSKTLQCLLKYSPYVVVTANYELCKKDLMQLTADRWNIMAIDPDSLDLVEMKQAKRWIDEITEERYLKARQEIDDDQALPDDPFEQMVLDCFEVDAAATEELGVRDHLLPVMKAAGYSRPNIQAEHVALGTLLARVFKAEIRAKTITIKKGGATGSRYIGLKIKPAAADAV